jgi:hypothetical protein
VVDDICEPCTLRNHLVALVELCDTLEVVGHQVEDAKEIVRQGAVQASPPVCPDNVDGHPTDLEAAEARAETWKGLATDGTLTGLRVDLAAAEKVVGLLGEALTRLVAERLAEGPPEFEEIATTALAAHDEWKKGRDE